jgi:ParB-like chromosome segregation protein Spo0J
MNKWPGAFEIDITSMSIDEGARQRKDLGEDQEINELASSLKNVGQINPIIISKSGQLLAGA